MGAKTFKRLAILVTAILVLGLSIFFFHGYQLDRLDRRVLAQAEQADEDEKYEKAARFYVEHLEVSPDDQKAKLKYAEVLLKEPKNRATPQAALIYTQYVNRYSDDHTARRRLVELLVELNDFKAFKQALAHVEILLKKEPKDGALNYFIGRCLEGLDEP
jgi:thioredoxin-like negative regulator of GroEL